MEACSYLCPNCGAPMEYNVSILKMSCSHCGNVMEVWELEELYSGDNETLNKENTDKNHNVTGEFEDNYRTGDFKVYRCKGCGAEVLTDENTAATFCSFCGRPSLMEDRLTGESMPSVVIPFKIKKEQALDIYKEWVKKGVLTPSTLKTQSTIEKITGMYVPFWLYDYNAGFDMTAKCTRVRTERVGEYEYIHTDHYIVNRSVETEYEKIPADASEKMPDDIMDKLEPFIYNDLTEFEMPYLSGFYAEKYNYDSEQMAPRVEERVKDYIYSATMDTVIGYSSVQVIKQHTRLGRRRARYSLLPVWVLNYKYMNKDYMFTLNGQTGKIVADRPISKQKMLLWFLGITSISFTLLFTAGLFI